MGKGEPIQISIAKKLDKLKIKYDNLQKKYDKLSNYHDKVMKAISCLPFSINEFLGDE